MKNKRCMSLILLVLISVGLNACDPEKPKAPARKTGFISGSVIDAQSRLAMAGVQVIVTDREANEIGQTTTDHDGYYEVEVASDGLYTLTFTRDGHHPASYPGVSVAHGETQILGVILQIDSSISGVGNISGNVTDAQTGTALAGVQLRFRQGLNQTEGDILAETTSDQSGSYQLHDTLETGHYTLEISLSGYVTQYSNILVLGGQMVSNQNASISQPPPPGEVRIILTWGSTPGDLDSHMTGPVSDNADERFHVYFSSRGTVSSPPFTALDVDDTNAFGPETITIGHQFQGVYRYSVHNFSNRGMQNNDTLARSTARVTVIRAGQPNRVFHVPNGTGTLWTVFELDGDNMVPINRLTDASASTSLIRSVRSGSQTGTDSALINAVPYK